MSAVGLAGRLCNRIDRLSLTVDKRFRAAPDNAGRYVFGFLQRRSLFGSTNLREIIVSSTDARFDAGLNDVSIALA
jgi:hypothetical protein